MSMKVLVLVKQVPDVGALRLDAARGRLIREGMQLFPNAFDLRALALAGRLKAERGAEVVAVTMGPPQAAEVLEFAKATGADRCILISDPKLAGSDTLVTARVLASLARREEPDVILAGQHSIDSETGQVPQELAALLDLPCLAAVREFELDEGGLVRAGCETEDGMEWCSVPLPAVLTTAERLMPPAKAKPEALEAVKGCALERLDAAALGLAPEGLGADGSPTWVDVIRPVESRRRPLVVAHDEGLGSAVEETVLARLARDQDAGRAQPWPAPTERPQRAVWVLLEAPDGELSGASMETLALACRLGDRVTGVLLADRPESSAARQAGERGADRVLVAHDPNLVPETAEAWAAALDRLLDSRAAPDLIVGSATHAGRGALSRLAARRGLGLTGDCIGIEEGEDGQLQHLKPAFGGNVVAPIGCRTRPELATLVPGSLPVLEARAQNVPLEAVALPVPAPKVAIERADRSAAGAAAALDVAELVFCVGNATGEEQDLALVRDCLGRAERALGLSGALAATRRVADAGILPRQIQVGLTGRAIAPRLYVGIGVRGAAYHMVGIRHCGILVAINQDPEAPIFQDCDLGIVGDWREVLPALVEALETRPAARRAGE